jgi:hypothetical protein
VASSRFIRELPKATVDSLSLVDIVAGGNALSKRANRGIDPTNGKISQRSPSVFYPTFKGDGKYHRVDGIPGVDGVFIPNGPGAVQVDSAGHTFDRFDKTDNLTYGHIWAGDAFKLGNAPNALHTRLDGNTDNAPLSQNRMLLVHANGGITFDLNAIRREVGHARLAWFRAMVGNLATVADGRTVNADLWVLVDGRQRFVRGQEAGRSNADSVNVAIQENDRFLTLAFTDGGDGCGWDWTVFIDPRLELVSTASKMDGNSLRRATEQKP